MKLRALTLASLAGLAAISSAQITLTDGGSSLTLNPNSSSSLISSWLVGGVQQVFNNTFSFRTGSITASNILSDIGAPSVTTTANSADFTYSANNFTVRVQMVLNGGANTADLAETVVVTNTGSSALNFTLFQYNDFDLNATSGNDTGTRLNSSSMQVSDGVVSIVNLLNGATPIPNFSELSDTGLLARIASVSGYTLNTAAGAGIGQTITNSDIAYAWQWNWSIAAGESVMVSTNKVMAVPEPGTMAALGLGALALLRRRNRK